MQKQQEKKKGAKVSNNKYIRFDWAAKNILRNKADYVVFEGLISVLVKEKVTRVNEFDKLATDPLEELIRNLKDEYISPDTTAPGLKEGRERLEYLRMTPEQLRKYFHDIDTQVRDTDVLRTQLLEARIEGRAEGRIAKASQPEWHLQLGRRRS